MTPQEALEILNSIHIQSTYNDQTPQYEKDLLQKYTTGISENNLHTIYALIDALERSNQIYYNKQINTVLTQTFNEHPEILMQYFSNETDCLKICFLFRSCHPNLIKHIALNTRENGLLIYEALRQIYLYTSNYGSKLSDIIEIMNHLAEKDVDKLTYFINKNQYSFSKEPFFSTLLQYATETLLTNFFTNIDIGHMGNILDFGKYLSTQSEECQTTFIGRICPIIITKWKKHCEAQKKNATILTALHTTQYFSLICISFEQTYNSKEIENLLGDALNIFLNDLHRWHQSSSKFLVYYFLNLTQIYIMLSIIENNNYKLTNELNTKLCILKNILTKTKSLWWNDNSGQFDLLLELIHIA